MIERIVTILMLASAIGHAAGALGTGKHHRWVVDDERIGVEYRWRGSDCFAGGFAEPGHLWDGIVLVGTVCEGDPWAR